MAGWRGVGAPAFWLHLCRDKGGKYLNFWNVLGLPQVPVI